MISLRPGRPLSLIDTIGVAEFMRDCDRPAQAHGERFTPNALLRRRAETGESFYGKKPADKAA